jgi:hypothetical protein
MDYVKNLSSFLLAGSKHSQYLRIQQSEYVGFPYAGWWEEREGKGRRKIHSSPSPLHKGSRVEFPMLAGRQRDREKGKEKNCPLRDRKISS